MKYIEIIGLKLSHLDILKEAATLIFLNNNKKIVIKAEDMLALKFTSDNIPVAHLVIQEGSSFAFDVSIRLKEDAYALYEELLITDSNKNIYLRIIAKSFTLSELVL